MNYLKSINKIFILIILFSFANQILAEVTIGTIERPPFSYQENGQWTGFSIDLWKEIASNLGEKSTFITYQNFQEMLSDTANKKNDLSVANISITPEREKIMDFSQPIYTSGFAILKLQQAPKGTFLNSIFNITLVKILLGGLIIFFLIVNILWLQEKKKYEDGGFYYEDHYYNAILRISKNLFLEIKKVAGYKILGILITFFIIFSISQMFKSVMVYGQSMNTKQIKKEITYFDLRNSKVGVTTNSSHEKFLNKKNISSLKYNSFSEMLDDLEKGEIEYILSDEPVLKQLIKNDKKFRFKIVSKKFNQEYFGILYPAYSPLRRKVDSVLIELQESGVYDSIYRKYFGDKY